MGYAWGQANSPEPEVVTVVQQIEVPAASQPPVQIIEPTFPVACRNAMTVMLNMQADLNVIMGAGGKQQDIVVAAKTAIMAQDPQAMVRAQNRQNTLVSDISRARRELQERFTSLQIESGNCTKALG